MKKDMILKAVERMQRYFNDIENEEMAGLFMSENDAYTKAWMKTCEQLDFDELDERSKIWFIEDESSFAKAYSAILEDAEKFRHMAKLFAKNLENDMGDDY